MGAFILVVIILAMICVVVYLCRNKEKESSTITFNAILNGENEVPPNESTALGVGTLVFHELTKRFTLAVEYSSTQLIGAHINKGIITERGDIIFTLEHNSNPIYFVSPMLTPDQEAALKANMYYVNLHTAEYPEGEIRGQLIY